MPIFPSDTRHIERAARHLRAGELVAFPTETVYGLGANALDEAAVAKIYRAKGRPAFNPLIVHVADARAARELVSVWNPRAEKLANAFWPGPLTLILPKISAIPDLVSAGLGTVALRVPSASIAQKLLRAAQIPLAAPSANASGEISPTRASHVAQSLGEEIWVLDGGACEVGIESTVVDISGPHSSILRPGNISERQIAAVIGPLTAPSLDSENHDAPRPSPGMLLRHYAPRARLQLFSNLSEAHFHAVALQAQKIGVVAFSPTRLDACCEIILPLDAALYAREIYAALRQLDGSEPLSDCDLILVEEPPRLAAWSGVRDRLKRAARDSSSHAPTISSSAQTSQEAL
ncbi:translation factor SUA5 [Abditibacterium utsteinense]|uniref:Threonylcarbamoyl-AMP synthase n=1 Tax=Abditibacterium utsteinense TaxID=1960156 RepID=A0A2S8STI2_9BACT|nr:L-threonylcarbamoyladenylate synthase [Abditibacterium utsteinense]PQV64112.1 translation factor SUA5 [Abditibacterium utsteinense]